MEQYSSNDNSNGPYYTVSAVLPCVSGKLGSPCWKGGTTGHTATLWMTLLQGENQMIFHLVSVMDLW